jgi:hypothetical protein
VHLYFPKFFPDVIPWTPAMRKVIRDGGREGFGPKLILGSPVAYLLKYRVYVTKFEGGYRVTWV